MMMKYRMVWLAIAGLMVLCHAIAQDWLKDLNKYKGMVTVEARLDEATGRVTYMIRNVSDQTIRLHMWSIKEAELMLEIEPNVDFGEVKIDLDEDIIDPHDECPPRKGETRIFGGPSFPPKPKPDRVVDLKKGEGLVKSFLIWEACWWKKLVAKLKTGKYKEYQIHPSSFIFTVDNQGKWRIDHHIEHWVVEPGPDHQLHGVFKTKGFIIGLKLVRKFEALRAQAEKRARSVPKPSSGP